MGCYSQVRKVEAQRMRNSVRCAPTAPLYTAAECDKQCHCEVMYLTSAVSLLCLAHVYFQGLLTGTDDRHCAKCAGSAHITMSLHTLCRLLSRS